MIFSLQTQHRRRCLLILSTLGALSCLMTQAFLIPSPSSFSVSTSRARNIVAPPSYEEVESGQVRPFKSDSR